MRVAVVHDWLTESGGAEKVTRELVDLFDADVFALVDQMVARLGQAQHLRLIELVLQHPQVVSPVDRHVRLALYHQRA